MQQKEASALEEPQEDASSLRTGSRPLQAPADWVTLFSNTKTKQLQLQSRVLVF